MNIIFFPYSQSITSKFVVPKLIVLYKHIAQIPHGSLCFPFFSKF